MEPETVSNYESYPLEELICLLKDKDKEIEVLKDNLRTMEESRNTYYLQNKFHIEEITRLDKIIGKYQKKEKE